MTFIILLFIALSLISLFLKFIKFNYDLVKDVKKRINKPIYYCEKCDKKYPLSHSTQCSKCGSMTKITSK